MTHYLTNKNGFNYKVEINCEYSSIEDEEKKMSLIQNNCKNDCENCKHAFATLNGGDFLQLSKLADANYINYNNIRKEE